MICIVDYGSGNVGAIMNLLKRARIAHFLSGDPSQMADATSFLLPGVGAFDPTISRLRSSGIVTALEDEVIGKGKPVLGICVGMHLLAEGSEEGELPGLGWVPGLVRRIDETRLETPPHLPHMGWNAVAPRNGENLFAGVDAGRGFYFLHSFYFDARSPENVSATVYFGTSFPCAVRNGNVHGVQFHPEKSHANGAVLLANFAGLAA